MTIPMAQNKSILLDALYKLKNAIKLHKFTHELHEVQIEMELDMESFNGIRMWFELSSNLDNNNNNSNNSSLIDIDSNATVTTATTATINTNPAMTNLEESDCKSLSSPATAMIMTCLFNSPMINSNINYTSSLVINVTLNESKPCWLIKKKNLEPFVDQDERFKHLFDDLHARISLSSEDEEGFEGSMGMRGTGTAGSGSNNNNSNGSSSSNNINNASNNRGESEKKKRKRIKSPESSPVVVPEAEIIILHSLYFQYDLRKQLFFVKAICAPGFL